MKGRKWKRKEADIWKGAKEDTKRKNRGKSDEEERYA